MKKRSLPKNSNYDRARRERDPIAWRYCFLTLACGALLVGGFFLAARSHFSSVNLGMKNATLKKQIEELEADKRRLLLAKEVALSPAEIKKAAKKLGLTEMTASNIEVARPVAAAEKKSISPKDTPQTIKTAERLPSENKPAAPKPEEKAGKTGAQKDKTPAKKDSKTASPILRR